MFYSGKHTDFKQKIEDNYKLGFVLIKLRGCIHWWLQLQAIIKQTHTIALNVCLQREFTAYGSLKIIH